MKTRFRNGLLAAVVVLVSCFTTASNAAPAPIPDPVALSTSLVGWKAIAQDSDLSWVRTTSFGDNFDTITSFTPVGGPTISFAPSEIRTIGTGWATWCCSYTGQVLYRPGASSVTWSFGGPILGFGVYGEPNPFAEYSMTLTTNDGGILTQTVDGDSGASFFGFVGSGVTSMTVSIAGETDFALGDVYTISAIPEPEIYAMLAAGLGFMGFVARRRKQQLAA